MAGATFESRRTTCAAHPTDYKACAPDGIVEGPCVPHASQEQQSTSTSRTMAVDGLPPSDHTAVPRTAREHMVARMPHACILAFTVCSGQLRAVLRASQTDLVCARARHLAGLFRALRSPLAPSKRTCKRTCISPSRCARALRWRARPLPCPCARVCPLSASQSDRACVRPSQVGAAVLGGRGEQVSCVPQRSVDCCARRLWLVLRPRPCRYRVGQCIWPVCAEVMRGQGSGRQNGRCESLRPQNAQPGCPSSIF